MKLLTSDTLPLSRPTIVDCARSGYIRAIDCTHDLSVGRGLSERIAGFVRDSLSANKRTWRFQFPQEPNWRDHWLEESEERVRELHDHEADTLDAAVRDDYAPWIEFVRLTGWRLNASLLRWSTVNWFARTIVAVGKGGRRVTTPITPEIRAVLEPLRGHHEEWVFTFVCRRNRGKQVRGTRYPITYEGAKSQWQRDRKRAGVTDFRFHDFRHDVATKLLRATGNLKLVQKALNHADIATTARYAHVLDDEVSEALSCVARSRKKSRTSIPNVA